MAVCAVDRLGFVFCLCISHSIQLTRQELSAEPKNSASAEALTVARRPKEASREKIRAAAGIRRLFGSGRGKGGSPLGVSISSTEDSP